MKRVLRGSEEAGFTLIEALIAIVILSVGLVGVTNLFVVATASNQIGNLGTLSTATASEVMEKLKAVKYTDLVEGGNLLTAATTISCAGSTAAQMVANYGCQDAIPGMGTVWARWTIENPNAGGTDTLFITVRSEVIGPFGGAARAEYKTFRTCTSNGCVY